MFCGLEGFCLWISPAEWVRWSSDTAVLTTLLMLQAAGDMVSERRTGMGSWCSEKAATGLIFFASLNSFWWEHLISSIFPEKVLPSWCFGFESCSGGRLTGDRQPCNRLGDPLFLLWFGLLPKITSSDRCIYLFQLPVARVLVCHGVSVMSLLVCFVISTKQGVCVLGNLLI